MSYAPAKYVATATQTEFDVPFPYLLRTHVEVLVNGNLTNEFSWVNDGRIGFAVAPGLAASVVVQRNTPIDIPAVSFQDSAVLTEADLNTAVAQLLFRHQELTALYNDALKDALTHIADNLGIVTNPNDVAQVIAENILAQEVLDTFRAKIAEIDANSGNLATQGAAIAAQAAQITSTSELVTTIQGLTAGLRTDLDSLSGVVDGLIDLGSGEGISALIAAEAATRADADLAQAATIALIGAKNGDGSAFILNLDTAKVSPTETLGARLTALNAADNGNAAAVTTEQTARIAGDAAEASARTALAATLRSETAAAISSEASTRASGDAAEASARTTLAATLRAETSAAVISEATARSSADGELASLFTLLGAKNGPGTAFVLNGGSVQVSPGVSLATRLSGVDTSLANNAAAIASEITARSTADAANADAITAVQATVGGLTSTVSTHASALSDLYGRTSARWTVTAVSGGRAQLSVYADSTGGGGVDIVGDVRINGNLLVTGSVNWGQLNVGQLSKQGTVDTGAINVVPGAGASSEFMLFNIGQTQPYGTLLFTYELTYETNVGRVTSTLSGKPYYINYLNDGAVVLDAVQAGYGVGGTAVSVNGVENIGLNASTETYRTLYASGQAFVDSQSPNTIDMYGRGYVLRNNYDSGVINNGDYYERNISATYRVRHAKLKLKWTFI